MKIEVFQTESKILNKTMVFRVMTPDGYELGDKNYPVLYMQDGQDLFYDEDAVDGESVRYAEYYRMFSRYLPKIIIVGIDCPMNNAERTALYTPYTKDFDVPEGVNFEKHIEGKGKEYLEFIVEELKPWIDSRFNTRPQRDYTAIGGFSSGAVVSAYALLTYPRVFSRMISLSGAFYIWMDKIEQTMEESDLDHVKYIYLSVGMNELGRYTTAEQFLEGSKQFYQTLSGYGFDDSHVCLRIMENESGHTHAILRNRLPDAIRWIYQDL